MFDDARMFCEKEKYACVLFDQIGSGRSDGLQAYIDDWFKYCQLAKEFIDEFILGQFLPSYPQSCMELFSYRNDRTRISLVTQPIQEGQ
mmetsp:Transcript_11533/g.9824  ORF Transcript_11533/g.9824 Transcript_11533/m.9824 type:complete len:89 (-) Transcript_11533:48-314(-)